MPWSSMKKTMLLITNLASDSNLAGTNLLSVEFPGIHGAPGGSA